MSPQVYIAGVKLETLAPVSGLVISHEWTPNGIGGPVTAEFTMLLPANKRPSWLTKDAPAEIRFGPGLPSLAGAIAEPDWADGSITINAAATEGSSTACLTTAGKTTSIPDTAIDAARARGALSWIRPASISTTALTSGDETADLNSISDMASAYCDANTNARLYVDPWRQILKGTDPTTPELVIVAGAGELAWTTETQADRVIGRWKDATGKLFTTMVGTGKVEKLVDLTTNGPLTTTSATTILNNILTRASSGGWTNGLTLSAEQFLGERHLATVADMVGRGVMVRNLGQTDPRPDRIPVPYVDFIPERSEWHVADGQIILTPRGMVARDWAAILAEAGVKDEEAT